MKLSSYVVRTDRGFAPNPQFGVLTLACCKPRVRKHTKRGDWILGLHSAAGTRPPGRVCFLAQVSDTATFDEYFNGPEYQQKKPSNRYRWGDNIYHTVGVELTQRPNYHHNGGNREDDISTNRVLVCRHFWYFGRLAPSLPPDILMWAHIRRNHRNIHGEREIEQVIAWAEHFPLGMQAEPMEPLHPADSKVSHLGNL